MDVDTLMELLNSAAAAVPGHADDPKKRFDAFFDQTNVKPTALTEQFVSCLVQKTMPYARRKS